MAKKNRKDNLGEISMEEEKVEVIIEEEAQSEQVEVQPEQAEVNDPIVEDVQPELVIEDDSSPTQADMHAYLTELRKKVNNETATEEEIEVHTRLSHLLQR